MKKHRFSKYLLVLGLVLALLLAALPALAADYDNSTADLQMARATLPLYSFFELGADVSQAQSMEKLMLALTAKDPYAKYMTAADLAAQDDLYFGSYVGIGILMEAAAGGETAIRCVYGDTIAAKAELKRGDIIYSVDGTRCAGKTTEQVQNLLSGKANSVMRLAIKRGDTLLEMDIKRAEMPTPSMYYWVDEGNIGYLKINRFTQATDEQLKAALDYLPQLGATSLMLDLRNCPGGLMDAAGECCALLSGGGPVFYNVARNGYQSFFSTDPAIQATDLPLAVLVNDHTASAAEMLAAVVQDAAAGTVIGSGTYGKGYYQTVTELPSGACIYFTLGKYITWGRQDIEEMQGVTPDIVIGDAELQYTTAAEWLSKQQALPKQLKLQANNKNAQADGAAWLLQYAPLNQEGKTYAAAEVLTKLGWELNYYQGKCYAFNGMRRLVFDYQSAGTIISGNQQDATLWVNDTAYLPLSFLSKVGYEVSWDGSVVISRE